MRDQLNAAPRVLIHEDRYAETARAAAYVVRLVLGRADGTGGEYGPASPPHRRISPGRGDVADACAILYTSGATGLPKGVVTHPMLFFNVVNYGMIVRVGQSSVHGSLPPFNRGLSQARFRAARRRHRRRAGDRSDYVLDSDDRLGITT